MMVIQTATLCWHKADWLATGKEVMLLRWSDLKRRARMERNQRVADADPGKVSVRTHFVIHKTKLELFNE